MVKGDRTNNDLEEALKNVSVERFVSCPHCEAIFHLLMPRDADDADGYQMRCPSCKAPFAWAAR